MHAMIIRHRQSRGVLGVHGLCNWHMFVCGCSEGNVYCCKRGMPNFSKVW
jgi:hypothetical protein